MLLVAALQCIQWFLIRTAEAHIGQAINPCTSGHALWSRITTGTCMVSKWRAIDAWILTCSDAL